MKNRNEEKEEKLKRIEKRVKKSLDERGWWYWFWRRWRCKWWLYCEKCETQDKRMWNELTMCFRNMKF